MRPTQGVSQRWAVEWGGTGQLAQAGVKRDTLKVGDKVHISGRPSRVPGEYRVLMVNLTRPADGFTGAAAPTRWSTRDSALLAALLFGSATALDAQRAGGRGRAGGPAPSPRQAAPIDLAGYWVSPIIEDWKYAWSRPPRACSTRSR